MTDNLLLTEQLTRIEHAGFSQLVNQIRTNAHLHQDDILLALIDKLVQSLNKRKPLQIGQAPNTALTQEIGLILSEVFNRVNTLNLTTKYE